MEDDNAVDKEMPPPPPHKSEASTSQNNAPLITNSPNGASQTTALINLYSASEVKNLVDKGIPQNTSEIRFGIPKISKVNEGNSVKQTRDRGYIITGVSGYVGLEPGDFDYNACLIKVDLKGNIIWRNLIGKLRSQQTESMGGGDLFSRQMMVDI